MTIERSLLLKLDASQVVGVLSAAGTRDPDALHALKARLVSLAKLPRTAGTALMVLGALCTALIVLAVIGIPLLVLGWWMRARGVKNVHAVASGWAEFMASSPAADGARTRVSRTRSPPRGKWECPLFP